MSVSEIKETVARIDENVKRLLESLPEIEKLKKESTINKVEHRIVFAVLLPLLLFGLKKVYLPLS